MGRGNILAIVAGVAVASTALGWGLGQRIRSPAEIAADTAAPEPSLITVPVEQRELASRVVVRGTVVSSGSTSIGVSGSTSGAALITRLPLETGDPLAEGDVALEVAGRPVIVLQGELPEFRSLAPGMAGPDVRQLEAALARMNLDPGPVDDLYTTATGAAVAALYAEAGYRANEPSRDELALIDSAQERVDEAQRALNEATGSGGSDGGLPESQRLQLDLAITHAQEAEADAKAGKARELAPLAEARDDTADAERAANDALATARSRLDEANAGTHPDTGQTPTPSELAALEAAVGAAESAAEAAATAASEAATAYTEAAVPHDRAIRDAGVQLEIARAAKAEAVAALSGDEGGGRGLGGTTVADLRKRLTAAQDDLADLQSTIGVTLPAAEFRFVQTLPSVVQSVDTELGATPSGTALTVSGASTLIESSIPETDRNLVEVGMTAIAEQDDLDIRLEVTIVDIADNPGGVDTTSDRYAIELAPNSEVPDEALFESFRITIPISSTGGEVLAVPLAAVSAAADGTSRVEVERGDGTELITVTTGLAADGFVEIRPVNGDLGPGDRVVVGRDLLLPAPDDEEDTGEEDEEDG